MHTWNMQERSRVLNKPESVVFFTEKEMNAGQRASCSCNIEWIVSAREACRTSCESKARHDPYASASHAMWCTRWTNNTAL
jgi:hypothetical protein